MVQLVKNPPAEQETQAGEDPLKKEMAVHSSILARKTPQTEEPGGLQGVTKELDTTKQQQLAILRYS